MVVVVAAFLSGRDMTHCRCWQRIKGVQDGQHQMVMDHFLTRTFALHALERSAQCWSRVWCFFQKLIWRTRVLLARFTAGGGGVEDEGDGDVVLMVVIEGALEKGVLW